MAIITQIRVLINYAYEYEGVKCDFHGTSGAFTAQTVWNVISARYSTFCHCLLRRSMQMSPVTKNTEVTSHIWCPTEITSLWSFML